MLLFIISSFEIIAPAEGRFFDLYLEALTNSPSTYSLTRSALSQDARSISLLFTTTFCSYPAASPLKFEDETMILITACPAFAFPLVDKSDVISKSTVAKPVLTTSFARVLINT